MTSYLQRYNIIVMYAAHHFAKNHFLKVNSQLYLLQGNRLQLNSLVVCCVAPSFIWSELL